MRGLMQDAQLTLDRILVHARDWHGDREVVTRSIEGPIVRTRYGAVHDRARRLSNALLGLGVVPGDLGGEAAHRQGARKGPVDQERTAALQELDQPVETGRRCVGEPALPQFFQTRCEKHGPSPQEAKGAQYGRNRSQRGALGGRRSARPGGVLTPAGLTCRPSEKPSGGEPRHQ